MIPFTMKILRYNGGTYTVEYIPEDKECKPVKLNIQLDQNTLHDKDQIIEKLKLSSPQSYWYDQIVALESDVINNIANDLVNTSHSVRDMGSQLTANPVNTFNFHPIPAPIRGPRLPTNTPPAPVAGGRGSSTPEQVAGPEEQNIIKLKILIQQVIQEMAEGTV